MGGVVHSGKREGGMQRVGGLRNRNGVWLSRGRGNACRPRLPWHMGVCMIFLLIDGTAALHVCKLLYIGCKSSAPLVTIGLMQHPHVAVDTAYSMVSTSETTVESSNLHLPCYPVPVSYR